MLERALLAEASRCECPTMVVADSKIALGEIAAWVHQSCQLYRCHYGELR